jgi:hypothetical protein
MVLLHLLLRMMQSDFFCLLLRKLLQQLLQHLQMKRGGGNHLHRCQSKRDGARTVDQHAPT